MRPFVARLLIVTSNKLPREWWSQDAVDDTRWKAAVRRMSGKLGTVRHLTTVINVDDDDNWCQEPDFDGLVDQIEGGIISLGERRISAVPEPDENAEPKTDEDEFENAEDDISYEEERYGSQAEYEAAARVITKARKARQLDDELKNWCTHEVEEGREMCDNCEEHAIQGGLIDITGDADDVVTPPSKKLKRTESTYGLGLKKIHDKRWGKQPTQSEIKITK